MNLKRSQHTLLQSLGGLETYYIDSLKFHFLNFVFISFIKIVYICLEFVFIIQHNSTMYFDYYYVDLLTFYHLEILSLESFLYLNFYQKNRKKLKTS